MASATQTQLFETGGTGRKQVDSHLEEEIKYQHNLDFKELKKLENLYGLVKAPAKKLILGEIKKNLSDLRETGRYCVRPYSSMSEEELVVYYTEIRKDISNKVRDAEHTLSLHSYPEDLRYR